MCWVQGEANLRICRFCRHDLVLAGTLTLIRGCYCQGFSPHYGATRWVMFSVQASCSNVIPTHLVFGFKAAWLLVWIDRMNKIWYSNISQPYLVWEITCIFFVSLISELLLFIDFSWRYDMRMAWADQPEPLDSWWWETVKNKTLRAPPEKPQRYSI